MINYSIGKFNGRIFFCFCCFFFLIISFKLSTEMRYYYYNRISKQCSWDKPPLLKDDEDCWTLPERRRHERWIARGRKPPGQIEAATMIQRTFRDKKQLAQTRATARRVWSKFGAIQSF